MSVPRFWREQRYRYNLIGTRCGNCSRIYFPPRLVCPECHRESIGKLEPYKLSGKGKIVSWTRVHQGPRAFQNQLPYLLAIIELDEGPKITAQIIDCDSTEDLRIGLKVRYRFRKIREDGKTGVIYYGYKFSPMAEEEHQ